jgi:hypothetical protein
VGDCKDIVILVHVVCVDVVPVILVEAVGNKLHERLGWRGKPRNRTPPKAQCDSLVGG